ncbi:MAG: Stk1 family PASTA domain-containing Ser/Thr kinase [Solirubrobacterales bacterium]|nr:Stk1 family PASTA domain-containing Ser/Thr kinase [Solirubrobacterales bacterium]
MRDEGREGGGSVPEVSEGSVIDGRYRVLRRIGSGGMADVWLADDPHLQRRVALKVLHGRFAQDREFVERFRREAEAAGGLQHPNVVAVFDRGDVDGTYYIAMQYLEGRSLKELIDDGLDPEQAVRLIRQVLEGAGFAHRHGVVHRDLKPQNVIVDADGKATVTDFGIARAGVSEITQTGSVMGTPHYLSPEQAQGQEVTAVSDLYSIGVLLYEALTGRVPFEGESAVAVAMKQVSQVPQRPSSINPQVSPALDAVVMRALEKDPGQRFQSASAFIAALDAALEEPGAAAGGTAAFVPLPPVVATAEETPAAEAGEDDDARRHRRRRWALVAIAVLIGALAGFALTRDTTTEVPGVTGNQLNVAIALLQQDGFEVSEVTRVQREAPQNTVLEQDPAASPPARQASLDCSFLSFFCSKPEVALTVSAGPGSAKVPGTAGLTREEAVAKLEEAGFDAPVETVDSETVTVGLVIHSDPSGGTTATRGSEVTLTVSRGPKLVKVPVLVGTQRAVAVQQIRGRGLVPSVSEEESSAAAGEVIRQSPSAGSELGRGSSVSIVVSKGQQQVTVPNVIGEERAAAVQALRDAGLKPSVQEQETDLPSQVGRVTGQFPPPGSRVDEGTAVTVVVGKASTASETTTAAVAP